MINIQKIIFDQAEIDKIISLYLDNGLSMKKIGILYNVNEHVIKRHLRESNITIRNSGQQYCYNSDYFQVIDTEIKAYFLGLITSDGNLTNPRSNKSTFTVQINIQDRDKIVLDIIANDIIIGGKPKQLIFIDRSKEKIRNQYKLSITNKKIFNDLLQLGLCEQKSLKLSNLCDKVPDQFYHHYIRGLFDGDGTVNINKDKTCKVGYYSGSETFVKNFQEYCVNSVNMSNLKIYKGATFFCSWSKLDDIRKFFNFIYKNASIYIPRKYNKFLEIFNIKENSEEIITPKKVLTP